jgi:branched-subunit amino acid transport protein
MEATKQIKIKMMFITVLLSVIATFLGQYLFMKFNEYKNNKNE